MVSGVAAQYESEVIYNSIREDLASQGVIFVDTDTAVQKYPELVKKYFATVIPVDDNKFAALNTAAWRRLVCVRAKRRACGYSAAGLLPH